MTHWVRYTNIYIFLQHIARDFFVSFSRYEDQKEGDIDAHLAKEFDKFDMILQAFEVYKND